MKLKKLQNSIVKKILPFRYELDDVTDTLVRGWAKSNHNNACQVLVRLTSPTDSIIIVADRYRGDVRRAGQHSTGFCGFNFDISSWKNKKVTITVLDELANQVASDFSPVFFSHIPKTAGTSFKKAAQEYFGASGVARNYGKKSVETTQWISKTLLEAQDYPGFYNRLCKDGISLYMGHTHLMPAANVFKAVKLVTFLRDPIEQVLSHYNHYCRWYNYDKSVAEFVATAGFKNLQSRFLKGVPLQLVGLIGITEKYDQSITLYNNLTQHNLKSRVDNVNDKKTLTSIDSELKELIKLENKQDLEIYSWAKQVFDDRLSNLKENKPWCFGFIDKQKEGFITGVAYWCETEEKIELVACLGMKEVGRGIANLIRPELVRFGVPNKGFIGFRFSFSKDIEVRNIKIKVATTGQVLNVVKYS